MLGKSLRLSRLVRDSNSTGLRIVLVAVAVAVASVTSVGFFTDRVRLAIEQRSSELLAADARIEGVDSIPDIYTVVARRLDLKTSRQIEFPSVILDTDGIPKLVAVKVVEKNYPLRGRLRISNRLFVDGMEISTLPKRGSVWVDSALLSETGFSLNQSVELGASSFRLSRILSYEPDRAGMFSQLAAPRILMTMEDIKDSELLSPASRARYSLLVAGDSEQVSTFVEWARDRNEPSLRIRTVEEVEPEIRSAVDRAANFLGLASIVAIVISGAAIFLATQLYARQQQDTSAIMRCLGASQNFVLKIFLGRLLTVACLASMLGCIIGLIAQYVLAGVASNVVGVDLPMPSLRPIYSGVIVGTVISLGFGLAPILSLRQISVLKLLRNERYAPRVSSILSTIVALAAIFFVLLWQSRDLSLTLWIMLLLSLLVLSLMIVATLLIWIISRLPVRHMFLRYPLVSLARRPSIVILQVVVLGAGIMALLILAVIRVGLFDTWQASFPDNAPNRFVINIQPDQKSGIIAMLESAGFITPTLFPMARGRFVPEKSDGVWRGWDGNDQGENANGPNDFNLSFSKDLPEHNRLIEGSWWEADQDPPEWSLEEGIADSLGVETGDFITFSIGESDVTGQVANIRRVVWDSFEVNFFVIGKPYMLEKFPFTYITSLYLPHDQARITGNMVRQFPGVTIFNIEALISQMRSIIADVSKAVQYVFSFTLFAGLVVLYGAVQVGAHDRMREVAILRSLGAKRSRIWSSQFIEFVILGLIAGLVAALFASFAGYILSKNVFELSFKLDPVVFIYGALGGGLGVGLAGLLTVQNLVRRPPLQGLQR